MSDIQIEMPTRQKTPRWRLFLTLFTLGALILLVYLLREQIGDVVNNLGRVNTWALLLILPLQFFNYHAYARLYQRLFKTLGHKTDYWPMYKLGLESNFVNHVLPSGGVSGVSYFSLRMKAFGVSASKGALAQVMKFGLIFLSFQILLLLGLLTLAVAGRASNLTILVAGSLATLVVVGTFMGAYILESKSRIRSFLTFATHFFNRLISFFRPKQPETINVTRAQRAFEQLHEDYLVLRGNIPELKVPLFYALLANLTEVLTIYAVYVAFGEFINIGAVILAYAVATFAGLISVIPGGVGVYEALMTAVLVAAGVPASLSLPVTVMYRVLTMGIQLPIGYFFYHQAVAGRGFENREPD